MKDVEAWLKENSSLSLLFVGIGNRLKSDDAVGIYICENIQSRPQVQTLIVESGIEKHIGKINSLSPDILVLVDSTDFNQEPGYAKLMPIDKVQDNTFNTHTISIKRIAEFFKMKSYLLGVQPQIVGYGECLSTTVKELADRIIDTINNL